jgi:NAD(P)-dependent dehydrogenase (short-subunit alcohol dehydrogenase family)
VRPLAEQTILVTGATDGHGKALATELARAGATVILHGRDDAKGETAIQEIRGIVPHADLDWERADLASLDEVRAMADRVESEVERIDALVNNAGIGPILDGSDARMVSRDGYELRFAVNYLAPFLLTRRLEPLLGRSAPARIVNVSSAGQAPIDFDDVMLERSYDGVRAYCQSKLAQVMNTIDLAEHHRDDGVTANCLHPATLMPTKLVLSGGIKPRSTVKEGMRATYRLVADPALDGISGRYFDGELEAAPDPQALDPNARRRLRELSEELTGV